MDDNSIDVEQSAFFVRKLGHTNNKFNQFSKTID